MNEIIEQLKEAVRISPDNIPLRLHLADLLAKENLLPDAAEQYTAVLQIQHTHVKALAGLSVIYFHQQKYSAAIILLEQLQEQGHLSFESRLLLVRCLLRERSVQAAKELYTQILGEDPAFRDEEIDQALRSPAIETGMEADELLHELSSAGSAYFMEKPAVNFSQVGGMKQLKNEIALKIIHPLQNPGLYKAFGKKTGGGILMYGPPGCGKTFIAKATAGEINARFISIGLHDILDMWIGNSEKNLHEIFQLARRNQPCVLFIDEVDALGASRTDMRQSAMRQVINQFLAELDGVKDSNEGVLVLAATNAPWSVDSAFRRPGRFDRVIFVMPPDEESRHEILVSILREKPTDNIDIPQLAKLTNGYSGADLQAVVDIAVEAKLEESLAKGALQPVTQKDLTRAIKQHKATTGEWFSTARNYALYANESGLYDDILQYLNLKK